MPLASDGKRLFPVEQTNSYGRVMIQRQKEIHDDLIGRAPLVVQDRVEPIYMKQLQVLHKAERFKPSYNQMKQRQDDDIVMSNLIRDAKCTSVNKLDGHILRFRELRQKHPNFIPGWLKRYEDKKSMEVHDDIIRKSRKWIDDEPPVRALNYRSVLQKTPFTRGGFPRIINTVPSRRKRRRCKKSRQQSLPLRRSASSMSHTRQGSGSSTPHRRELNTSQEARHEHGEHEHEHGAYSTDAEARSDAAPQSAPDPADAEPAENTEHAVDTSQAAAEGDAAAAAEDTQGEAGVDQHTSDDADGSQTKGPDASVDGLIDPDLLAAAGGDQHADEQEDNYDDDWDEADGGGDTYDQPNDN